MDDDRPLYETIELEGMQLIEASAGTGKTYTLVEIYKRLLKEAGTDIERVLIVTFTKPATEDVRKKVREGLLAALKEDNQKDSGVLAKLGKAAERMNEAPVSTIHAFSLQAAEELSFESGALFARGDQVDDEAVYREVCGDYWRFQTVGRSRDWVAYVLDKLKSPESLFGEKLRPVLAKPSAEVVGPNLRGVLDLYKEVRSMWEAERKRALSVAHQVDQTSLHGKNGALLENIALGRRAKEAGGFSSLIEGLDRTLTQADIPLSFPGWLDSFEAYPWPDLLIKGHKEIPQPFGEGFLMKLLSLRDAVVSGVFLIKDALEDTKRRARVLKRERRLFSYADMVEDLYEAVRHKGRGQRLAQGLAGVWPFALVDEFQDTDPMQYEILKILHKEGKSKTLVMIGDPKQAIYSFRGADVFSYLKAAKMAKASERNVLKVNYRSSPGVVAAINRLFQGDPNPFLLENIEYREAVHAVRNEGVGVVCRDADGKWHSAPALTIWELQPEEGEGPIKAPQARAALLTACIEGIVQLLEGTSGLEICESDGQGGVKQRGIRPGDVAVLVNANFQAAMIQKGLAKRGVPSVCLHQQSVFQTDEAEEVLRLLKAAASPQDDRAVRSALVSILFRKTLEDFALFAKDTEEFEKERDTLKSAKDRWERAGVLAMLSPFIREAAPFVLSLSDGERRMSNYIQLSELLADAEASSFGIEGLIRYLERKMTEDREDTAQIRLENDEDLVRISTVHKAKGLEYGIVFLPFAPFFGVGKDSPKSVPYSYHDDKGNAKIAFQKCSKWLGQAVREYRAEGVRLLYVGLTRAKYAIFLGHGPINTAQNGALAWVLHRGEGGIDPEEWVTKKREYSKWFNRDVVRKRLRELAWDSSGAISTESPPKPTKKCWRPEAGARLKGARSDFPQNPEPWGIASFSSLAFHRRPVALEPGWEDEASDPVHLETAKPILLRGRSFGNAFHSFMEKAEFGVLASPNVLEEQGLLRLAKDCFHAFGIRSSDGAEEEKLARAFLERAQATVCEPLPGLEIALKEIPKEKQAREMEFFFRLGSESTSNALFDALKRNGLDLRFQVISSESLYGLMNGFIDVVFQRGRRYYILDYKTNDLDLFPQGYTKEGIHAAMISHAYPLQYTIYLIALHRHLKAHLEGYTPEMLGGVYYLFVRGLNGSGERGIFSTDAVDPSSILEIDGLLDKGGSLGCKKEKR